jgi:hypothetical protein
MGTSGKWLAKWFEKWRIKRSFCGTCATVFAEAWFADTDVRDTINLCWFGPFTAIPQVARK